MTTDRRSHLAAAGTYGSQLAGHSYTSRQARAALRARYPNDRHAVEVGMAGWAAAAADLRRGRDSFVGINYRAGTDR